MLKKKQCADFKSKRFSSLSKPFIRATYLLKEFDFICIRIQNVCFTVRFGLKINITICSKFKQNCYL